MTLDLVTLIQLGGLLHFTVLIASALTPGVLNWRTELLKLHPLSRQVIWVHGAYIVLTIIGLGLIATFNAPVLAGGDSLLARFVTAFIAVFWLVRLTLQFAYFDSRPMLTTRFLRMGHHALTCVFGFLGVVFTWAAIRP